MKRGGTREDTTLVNEEGTLKVAGSKQRMDYWPLFILEITSILGRVPTKSCDIIAEPGEIWYIRKEPVEVSKVSRGRKPRRKNKKTEKKNV